MIDVMNELSKVNPHMEAASRVGYAHQKAKSFLRKQESRKKLDSVSSTE